jgi:hypothetical protein
MIQCLLKSKQVHRSIIKIVNKWRRLDVDLLKEGEKRIEMLRTIVREKRRCLGIGLNLGEEEEDSEREEEEREGEGENESSSDWEERLRRIKMQHWMIALNAAIYVVYLACPKRRRKKFKQYFTIGPNSKWPAYLTAHFSHTGLFSFLIETFVLFILLPLFKTFFGSSLTIQLFLLSVCLANAIVAFNIPKYANRPFHGNRAFIDVLFYYIVLNNPYLKFSFPLFKFTFTAWKLGLCILSLDLFTKQYTSLGSAFSALYFVFLRAL